MERKIIPFTIVSCLLLIFGMNDTLLAQQLSEPENNFEYLWQTFDRNYGIFGPKKIDWDALYKVYRPRVTPQTTDEELFDIMASMLGHLNDNHVRLVSPFRRFQSGILGNMTMEDFSLDLIQRTYLRGKFEKRMPFRDSHVFTYGWLMDSIGYFHFRGFGGIEASTDVIDEIIQEFRNARGIVVDVRHNGGGDDRVGKLIADRFADRKRLYMITYTRNGPEHDDYTPPKYWYVEPDGPIQFTQPVILLTHRFSVSAAENFALAMRVLPHVTVVGDATSGVFADVYGDGLPNGWQFRCSYKLFVDYTGFCWEGIGVPADIRQTNTKEDIEQERDNVLELAMDLINTGALKPQDESGSLQNTRESLANTLSKDIDLKGFGAAIDAFHQARNRDPNSYYIDEEEMNALGERLSEAGQRKEALDVFKLNAMVFRQSWRAHETLGEAYMISGEETQARECYKKSMAMNRQSYPWEIQSFANADRITKGIKLLAQVLARTIDEKGITDAMEAFHRGKQGGPGTYYIDEGEINTLGYRLIGSQRIEEAIEIFKINVEEFPESWNVYDSLGEAYMVQGKNDLAIEYYEKSIELNPNNQNGIDILKSLKSQ